MKKLLSILLVIIAILTIIFLLGPKPKFEELNSNIEDLSLSINQLDAYVKAKEDKIKNLRPDNEARILWADSTQQKTKWSMVFLHGFSASPMCGDPIILEIAEKYKMNTYLARIAGHGVGNIESFKDLTPNAMIDSAKEALAIGKKLGEKVLVVGSSTGCTLASYLVAENPDYADALMYYSPNIDLYDQKSQIAVLPWGLQILRFFFNGNYREISFRNQSANQYWTTKYRLEGLVAMRSLVNNAIDEAKFAKITQPFFLGYWHKNEEEQDKIISIPAALNMYEKIGTPQSLKQKVAFKTVNAHVLLSKHQTQNIDEVRQASFKFLDSFIN